MSGIGSGISGYCYSESSVETVSLVFDGRVCGDCGDGKMRQQYVLLKLGLESKNGNTQLQGKMIWLRSGLSSISSIAIS